VGVGEIDSVERIFWLLGMVLSGVLIVLVLVVVVVVSLSETKSGFVFRLSFVKGRLVFSIWMVMNVGSHSR
jgi:hypothetical protein